MNPDQYKIEIDKAKLEALSKQLEEYERITNYTQAGILDTYAATASSTKIAETKEQKEIRELRTELRDLKLLLKKFNVVPIEV